MNFKTLVACLKRREGQTTVEYLLTTVALMIAFASIYKIMALALKNQFIFAAKVILKMYAPNPWSS